MLKKFCFFSILVVTSMISMINARTKVTAAQVIVEPYQYPIGVQSDIFEVNDIETTVNGLKLSLYDFKMSDESLPGFNRGPNLDNWNTKSPVGFFDFSGGQVEIVIKTQFDLVDAQMMPSSFISKGYVKNFAVDTNNNIVKFTLTEPKNITIMFNNSTKRAMHLFTGEIEEAPSLEDPTYVYFEPGYHDKTTDPDKIGDDGRIIVDSLRKNIYLAPGSFVKASIVCDYSDLSGATLTGRGIICGSDIQTGGSNLINYTNIKGLEISGVTAYDSTTWNFHIKECTDVNIDNVKILGYRWSSDGVDIANSQNVLVSNSFVRNCDDGMVVKAWSGGNNTQDVVFTKNSVWTSYGNAFGSTYESFCDEIKNIQFTDCDVIRNMQVDFNSTALAITPSDTTTYSEILFDNIRIEQALRLFDVNILGPTSWTQNGSDGVANINGVTFRNISYIGEGSPISVIKGYDNNHIVQNINFEDCYNKFVPISDSLTGNIEVSTYVDNMTITYNTTTIQPGLVGVNVDTENPEQGGFINSTINQEKPGVETAYYWVRLDSQTDDVFDASKRIPGAINSNYTPTFEDVGKYIGLTVFDIDSGYNISVSTVIPNPVIPISSSLKYVWLSTNNPQIGSSIESITTPDNTNINKDYFWVRLDLLEDDPFDVTKRIDGATNTNYTPTIEDVGKYIGLIVFDVDSDYNISCSIIASNKTIN